MISVPKIQGEGMDEIDFLMSIYFHNFFSGQWSVQNLFLTKTVSAYKSPRQPSDWNPTSYRKQKSDSDFPSSHQHLPVDLPKYTMPSENISQPAGKKSSPPSFHTSLLSSAANPHTLDKSHRQLLVAFGRLDWIYFPTPKCTKHEPDKYMISTASEQNGQLLKHFHKKRLGDLRLFDLSFRYCCWFWRCSTVAAIKHLALSKLPDSQKNFGCVDLNFFKLFWVTTIHLVY